MSYYSNIVICTTQTGATLIEEACPQKTYRYDILKKDEETVMFILDHVEWKYGIAEEFMHVLNSFSPSIPWRLIRTGEALSDVEMKDNDEGFNKYIGLEVMKKISYNGMPIA